MSLPAFHDITPDELDDRIQAYFDQMGAEERPFTVEGLAYHLGTDKHTLARYKDHVPSTEEGAQLGDDVRDVHCAPIKRAYVRCETWLAEKLHTGGSPVGAIFALKCGYKWQETPIQIKGLGGFSMIVDTSAADADGGTFGGTPNTGEEES